MYSKEFKVKTIAGDRIFSAEGSNILFKCISTEISFLDKNETIEIIISFEDIHVVSTAFIGRFHEHVNKLKTNYSSIKFRLTDLRKEIKTQFQKK